MTAVSPENLGIVLEKLISAKLNGHDEYLYCRQFTEQVVLVGSGGVSVKSVTVCGISQIFNTGKDCI